MKVTAHGYNATGIRRLVLQAETVQEMASLVELFKQYGGTGTPKDNAPNPHNQEAPAG